MALDKKLNNFFYQKEQRVMAITTPYLKFLDITNFIAPGFSPREAFHSSLRKTDLSQENYEYLQQVWRENGMSNLRDLLTWYKNKDTRAFIEVLEKPCDFHQTLGLDMLKDSVSIPGRTLRHLFTMPRTHFFSLMREKEKDLYGLLRK